MDASKSIESLYNDPDILKMLIAHVESAARIAVNIEWEKKMEEMRAETLGIKISSTWDYVVSIRDKRRIKGLLDMFLTKPVAKVLLEEFKDSVNKLYSKNSIRKVVQDVVVETKNFLKHPKMKMRDTKLTLIQTAIDTHTSSPSGKGFIQAMIMYHN